MNGNEITQSIKERLLRLKSVKISALYIPVKAEAVHGDLRVLILIMIMIMIMIMMCVLSL